MNALLLASSFTDVRPGLIIWTWITFAVVAFALRKFLWRALFRAVENREKSITYAIESAQRERTEAEKLLAEQKVAIAQARQEGADAVRKTQADMEKFREEVMAQARKEAELLHIEARKMIEGERVKVFHEMKHEAVALSIQVAEKLLAEKLDDERHRQLTQKFISDVNKQASGSLKA